MKLSSEILSSVKKRFILFTTAKKILVGYAFLSIIAISIAIFTLSGLIKLNELNSKILHEDIPVIDATERMIDALLSQELYARQFAILKKQETYALFERRKEEALAHFQVVKAKFSVQMAEIQRIEKLFNDFNQIFAQEFKDLKSRKAGFKKKFESEIKLKRDELFSAIKSISNMAYQSQKLKTQEIEKIVSRSIKITFLLGTIGILLGAVFALIITSQISRSVNQLKSAIDNISMGNLDFKNEIKRRDEFGALSLAFDNMTARLKELEEMHLDASPLTRFPGAIAIENTLLEHIKSNKKFAFCLIDIDNFKSYNDKYGYARGSDVIKMLANVIEDALNTKGTTDDFKGHIGGDDFVVITSPERYPIICDEVTKNFDRKIVEYYNKEDLEKGCIISKNRQGKTVKFPLLTVSIAVVTNLERKLDNPAKIGEIAAELKEYAKTLPGSVWRVDKRKI